MVTSANAAPARLSELAPGTTATVRTDLLPEEDAAMLRALGLRPDATIRVCRTGEPCIVEVQGRCRCGCRIGIARDLARRLSVATL